MPLEPVRDMMKAARKGGYAIGYFESWNFESLEGVIDAAESARAPIIIGFNGEFLSRAGRVAKEPLSWYAALARAAAESARVPCSFIFNECADDTWVKRAIAAGFPLVMPADPDAPAANYRQRVRDLARLAHAKGACVEAELGTLPNGVGHAAHDAGMTDPQDAADFVEFTGCDLLAVSVGNVHIKLRGSSDLDLAQLGRIHERVSLPLVLHGGTGISARSLRGAIKLGVAKVNYGTYLKQRYLTAVRAALRSSEPNPHELLGIGGKRDVMTIGRRAVRDAVLERLPLLGCARKG